MTKYAIIVDDNPDICELVSDVLSSAGYSVSSAPSGAAALQISPEILDSKSVLIADFNLPDMKGLELCEIMLGRYPNLKAVCISGELLNERQSERIHCTFLPKPFTISRLLTVVTDAMADHRRGESLEFNHVT
jgi:DNA-binding NtrC family response regulator